MFGFKPSFGGRLLFVAVCWLAGGALIRAADAVRWDFVDLPANGIAGQTIHFSAGATNAGTAPWTTDYFLELSDDGGEHLGYLSVAGTPVGFERTGQFSLSLPANPGTYVYIFRALRHGAAYFGPTMARAIVVRAPPLPVSLELDREAITIGERAIARTLTDAGDEVALHGIEVRPLGGRWQTLAAWEGSGGLLREATADSADPGIFELRAFVARDDDGELSYSARAFLTVIAVPPAIGQQPDDAVVTIGERVTLTVTTTGSPAELRWRKDGVDLAGATIASLTLSPAQVAQSGTYSVVASNVAGSVTSRAATVVINPLALPAPMITVTNFPGGGARRSVALTAAQTGDVTTFASISSLTAGTGWRHNLLVRRPGITARTAIEPEDGSGFTNAHAAWNKDGWGSPHTDGNSYDARVTGQAAVDLGNREPFVHPLATGQAGSTRSVDFVLDAPGEWVLRAEVTDGLGQLIAASATTTITVAAPVLPADPVALTYPYGRTDRFVGVYWNAGQAHRLWSTWRADYDRAYGATWAVNWKLMWQPSPYFRSPSGGWYQPNPAADSPWQAFWSGHQVYALVPDATAGSKLTHDLTSRAFAEKAALRLMDIGVDFVAVDYTNQFLEEREDVLPAVNNLALAFQSVAPLTPSGQRVRLTAVVPANVSSGDWGGNGGFTPGAIARFSAKLTTLYERYARFESAWFYLEDDDGAHKPLLLLWIGAGGEDQPDGTLSPAKLAQLRLGDGRAMTDVFTVRWVGAYLAENPKFLTNSSYRVRATQEEVSGRYGRPKIWSYHEHFPSTATLAVGATGERPAVEAITVQPLAANRDRFGRAWNVNWPAGQGYHYETPAVTASPPLAGYGQIWRDTLAAARALDPKFLLTTWAEFGSENDEPRPELAVTIMDNNKFGTHFGDAFRQAVRLFKYRAPSAWIDTLAINGASQWIVETSAATPPTLATGQTMRLQGWVTPNVATTFTGGRVAVFVDEQLCGSATIAGAWNGATGWTFDLTATGLAPGAHTIKVLAEDGNGGAALAGVQFRGEAPRNVLPIVITAAAR